MDAVRGKPVLIEDHPKEPRGDAASFESLFRCHAAMKMQDQETIKPASSNGMTSGLYFLMLDT